MSFKRIFFAAGLSLCCLAAVAGEPDDSLKVSGHAEETVSVGYGVRRKSVVTSSISKVSSQDLGSTTSTSADDALKGMTAGVSVSSSSADPSSSSKVRIRGTGTVNNADPLYLVDGMPVEGGIDFLNPSDIESMEVLKDAASAAVYGARAANGVILVTTKKGSRGAARVNYDFRYGVSSPWRKRSVLNAAQYAEMMNQGRINAGSEPLYADPSSFGEGTDWQDLVFNYNAPQSQHELSLSGADEKINYYLSLGYLSREGIVGGQYGRSSYDRLTLRSNTSYVLLDTPWRSWLNNIKVSLNLSYSKINSTSVSSSSKSGTPLSNALQMPPILSLFATEEQAAQYDALYNYTTDDSGAASYLGERRIMDENGRVYLIPGGEYNNIVNPVAFLKLPAGKDWSEKYVGSFTAEVAIVDNLKFRTSLGYDKTYNGMDSYNILYYLSSAKQSHFTKTNKEIHQSYVWQIENTLTWDKAFGKHSLAALLGQSAKESGGNRLGVNVRNLRDVSRPYIDYTSALEENGDYYAWGAPLIASRLSSYFIRMNYDYDERYMAETTVRIDGSSRFGPSRHWATFPSVSLGWNIAREPFMEGTSGWLSAAKLRASWGQNGNENIGDYLFASVTAMNANYIFGDTESISTGTYQSGLANADLHWETTTQTDIGLDLGLFDGALSLTLDWYNKRTEGILMEVAIPKYVGDVDPTMNVGAMDNSGFEMEAGWRFSALGFDLRLSGNLSYLKNTMVDYGNDSGWANLVSEQGTGTITRAENGLPFPYFYGYKTDGIFQNYDEINTYRGKDGSLIMPSAVPGDVRFVDVDGNGKIDSDDRTYIGKGSPDWVWGVNLQAGWKGFDLSLLLQGSLGNSVFDASRSLNLDKANLPSYMLGSWNGEGTSNRYPRYVTGDSVNWQSSDLYVYDASFARLRNIQLGYTLPSRLTRRVLISNLRLYVSAENLFTLTSYHGYDPEVTTDGTSLGIDYGATPQARTFMVGLNVLFGGR